MTARLTEAALGAVPDSVAKPGYDRTRLRPRIAHLGIGNFHRAHQAVYVDQLLAKSALDWGISGISLRTSGTRDRLQPQDYLYTVEVRDNDARYQRHCLGKQLFGWNRSSPHTVEF